MKKYLRPQYIITLVHFVISFFFDPIIFHFHDNFSVNRLTPINLRFSDTFELVMTYTISKVIALVLIFLIWKLVFMLFSDRIKKVTKIVFVTMFVVGALILLILFPGSFSTSGDNFIVYAHTVNFIPDYWFSVYTSCYYAGCMMVLPHPYMIVFIHWLGFVFAIGYIYSRIENSDIIPHKFKYSAFGMFLFPYVYVILTDAYRTELYCVLCAIYMGIIILDIIEKRKRSIRECIALAALAALVGVWRTEGIVLAAISFAALTIFVYFENIKKLIISLAVFGGFFLLISFPQKVGNIKYYGNDYTIINLTRPLGMILNDPEANLSYEGADLDIAAIDNMVPVIYLKEFYLDGYRRRNIAIGSRDINQSRSALEISDAFVKAGYSLFVHNPDIYLATQWNLFNTAFDLNCKIYQPKYEGEPSNAPAWTYDMWEVGEEIFYESPFTRSWDNLSVRQTAEKAILSVRTAYLNFCNKAYIVKGINLGCILLVLVLSIAEFIRVLRKRKCDGFLFACGAVLLQYIAIFLVMPAGNIAYFRGTFFSTYVIAVLYPVYLNVRKRESK